MPVKVLLADDNALFREGMASLLQRCGDDVQVIGQAKDGAEAVRKTSLLRPDVVLMDLSMPLGGGVEATRQILEERPEQAICMLTVSEQASDLFTTIRAGARGYLLKDADQIELLRAIQTVASGGVIFSPGIAGRVLQYLSESPPNVPSQAFDELTGRERDILDLLARGYTNPEIAARLGLSPKTVSNHISNVLLKVQATDRAKLMLLALEAGLGQEGRDRAGRGHRPW